MITKIHASCDALGNPTGFHLTAGQLHNLQGSDVLLPQIVADIKQFIADKAYDAARRVIDRLGEHGAEVVISPKTNRKEQRQYDQEVYKWRHLIENFFQKLKQYRVIATRYDKRATSFMGGIYLAASVISLN